MTDAPMILKSLGDKTRYNILCNLYHSDSYVELLASKLGLTPGTISYHLKKMEADGLVNCSRTQFYIIYSLNRDILTRTVESLLSENNEVENDDLYRNKVLSSFFKNGRLQQIPIQEKKREIVLSEIMKRFNKKRFYTEAEVNCIINDIFDDYCTIRRWLIADCFMSRDHEIYTVLKQ